MNQLGLRVAAVMLLVLGMCLASLVKVPERADGVGGALVTVLPDTGNQALFAEVDPVRGGIVTLTGKVRIDQPVDLDAQYVTVQLYAEVGDWEVTRIPLITAARIPTIIPFSVSVVVPQNTRTSGLDVTEMMTITGSWSYEPGLLQGQVEPVDVLVYIRQFYQYRVRCSTPYIHTSPGGEFDLELEIVNEGNGKDEVTIEIDRRDRMEDHGWTFVFDKAKYELPHGETIKVKFHVSTPKKWDAFRNNIVVLHFTVSSDQAIRSNAVSENAFYSVFVRQRGVAVPGFEVPLMLLALLAAVSFSYIRKRRR